MNAPETTYPAMRKAGYGLLGACALVAGGLAAGKYAARSHEAEARAKALAEGPLVKVQSLALSSGNRKITMQAEALPYASTTLYAKVSGFLRTMAVDKGDRVRAGQVMGVLQSPEVEQDLAALQADAETKRANARRAEALGKDQILSQRDVEQAQSDAKVAEAKLASQATLKGYQVLRAPFDGVVTARYADPGALDLRTRTMLAEVELDNRQGQFLPGGFMTATLSLKVPPRLELPVEGLVMRGDKAFAAVLGPDHRVQLRSIQVGAEEAGRLPVAGGLQPGDKVLLNPGDAAQDGAKIRPAN
jgi:multidrug efflux pump subunit AcrA (membrane-fusion protein)